MASFMTFNSQVIYYFESSEGFHLLDGDRIATLVAGHLQQLLAEAGLSDQVECRREGHEYQLIQHTFKSRSSLA